MGAGTTEDDEHRERIRLEARQRMAELGWDMTDLVRQSGLSYNAVRFFLVGERWPKVATMRRLEQALDWEPGYMERLVTGVQTGRSADLLSVATAGGDAVVRLAPSAFGDLSDIERDELAHWIAAQALARAAEIRARHRGADRGGERQGRAPGA